MVGYSSLSTLWFVPPVGFILSTYSHQISQTQLCIPIFCGVRYRPLNFHKHELLENPQSLRWAVPVQLGEWGKPFIRLTVDSILEQVECMKHVQGGHLWAAQTRLVLPSYVYVCRGNCMHCWGRVKWFSAVSVLFGARRRCLSTHGPWPMQTCGTVTVTPCQSLMV